MFRRLVLTLNITAAFFDLVSMFSYKNIDSDGLFTACYSCFQRKLQNDPRNYYGKYMPQKYYPSMNSSGLTELDICYNIRYVELHGRDRKDPWSFRNLALYHRYSRAGESAWIFISLPVSIRERLKLLDKNEDYHHMLWHLDVLINFDRKELAMVH